MTTGTDTVAHAYNVKYGGDGFRNSNTYYQWVLSKLQVEQSGKLLDIACGMGDLLHYASELSLECYGIDLSSVAIEIARRRAPGAFIKEGNAEAMDFADEMFDYVTMLGSLEHLLDPGKGLLEIRRVLRYGGKAIILVPNGYYLPDLLWQVGRYGLGPNHKQIVERFAAMNEWRAFIESGGLAVQRIWRYDHQFPRCKDDWEWYRQNPRRFLKLAIRPFTPKHFAHSFMYLCLKDPASRGKDFHPPFWPAPPRLVDLA